MILWNFGNTTVRSPFRLRDGLILIYEMQFEGALRGKEQEKKFNLALAKAGIIELKGDNSYSIGRKWRSALTQHGFLYPKSKQVEEELFSKELGKPDTITPNGLRLIKSETISGWQECFLRSLAAYIIPSYLEPKKDSITYFSPLRFVLQIMIKLAEKTGDSRINFLEMATIVQCNTPNNGIENIVQQIISLREKRNKAERKNIFDQQIYKELAERYNRVAGTFRDYADVNIRYLKATGLFHAKGKGIVLSDEKRILIEKLSQEETSYKDDISYLKTLTEGSVLPFDNYSDAMIILEYLTKKLEEKGEYIDSSKEKLDTPSDIAIVRYKIEDRLLQLNELEYAKQQALQIDEILAYLELFVLKKDKKELDNGSIIEIPKSEKPAYLEWIIWRAFLAINSLQNMPWDARRFKIDQDFYPIGTAPGGGPDMIFEFDDMVLVVEVTLTTSSRQEAAEGEPVRRHVAKYAEKFDGTGKRVFGLFIAINIDTNTANTFRLGEWYLKDDKKIGLHIVPFGLDDFKILLQAYSNNLPKLKNILRNILIECRVEINNDAPIWKQSISSIIKTWVENI